LSRSQKKLGVNVTLSNLMIDRTRYPAPYAPPAAELLRNWAESLPSSSDLESFFLSELCESSEHDYFLCNADLFLDVVNRQSDEERRASLGILSRRLVDAAEYARGCKDDELRNHFHATIRGYATVYQSSARWDGHEGVGNRQLCIGFLALQAVLMDDLPLARCILLNYHELNCPNPDCENKDMIQCPECDAYVVAYDHHRITHNSCNVPEHPKHPQR
jgi:hypothetical protein